MKYLILLIIFIILLPAFVTLMLHKSIGLNQQSENHTVYFYGNQNYTQNFTSPKENLNSLSLRMKNTSLGNKEPVTFSIYSASQKITQLKLNGSNIGDGGWVRFSFDKISDSKNRTFRLELSSLTSTPVNAIGVQVNSQNETALITYHIPSSKLNLIYDIYLSFFKKVLQDPIFIIIWFFSIVGTIIFVNKLKIT